VEGTSSAEVTTCGLAKGVESVVVKPYSFACLHVYEACPEKHPAILNISRTGQVALMLLGSQSGETSQHTRGQLLSRGASQSAVRRR